MRSASGRSLSRADGDYGAASQLTNAMGAIGPELASDLDRLEAADIPVGIHFEQRREVLG